MSAVASLATYLEQVLDTVCAQPEFSGLEDTFMQFLKVGASYGYHTVLGLQHEMSSTLHLLLKLTKLMFHIIQIPLC